MLAATSFNIYTAAAAIAVVGAIVAGIVALRKLGPEKNALYITSAQGATVILNDLVVTLREEVGRGREEIGVLEAANKLLETENEALRAEVAGLRRRKGTRRADG